ncbi:MAG: hypothetical protein Unbinned7794contig1000_41 [Prokaryotic dsDNA virus sp.]|nr:MAG: hypothetical protein Unbinned7794contig1000_41 [Prokaryotic dsDNA virus sp.]|tara:strand:- start:13348 stop:13638 length:291 start_codon:yes stop_codon:yes gene_type:complete
MSTSTSVRPTSRGVRIWIEGKQLTEAGFTKGQPYTRTITQSYIIFALSNSGKLKVAGSPARPIIDFSAKQIEGFPLGTQLLVTYQPNLITIERVTV